jgi:hypothetical protein
MPTIQTNCLLGALLCFALATPCPAQSPQPDTPTSPAAAKAALFYQSYIGADAAIYNGYAYQPNYHGIQGSPLYPGDNLTEGTMQYESLTYTHLQLLYNVLLDQPILSDPQGQLICPPAGKIRQFTIGNHIFIRLSGPDIDPGFYELLRSGYVTLLARHTKTIDEKVETGVLYRTIVTHDKYYLDKQGHYYTFDSQNGLLALLPDKYQELRQFGRAQHLRFKKDPVTTMEKLIDYYNQLLH